MLAKVGRPDTTPGNADPLHLVHRGIPPADLEVTIEYRRDSQMAVGHSTGSGSPQNSLRPNTAHLFRSPKRTRGNSPMSSCPPRRGCTQAGAMCPRAQPARAARQATSCKILPIVRRQVPPEVAPDGVRCACADSGIVSGERNAAREIETLLPPRPHERLAQRLLPRTARHGFPESRPVYSGNQARHRGALVPSSLTGAQPVVQSFVIGKIESLLLEPPFQ